MKKVLVTGGSSGIGREITLFLLNDGYEVLFTYFQGVESAEEITKAYKNARKYKIDFTAEDEMPPFLDEIRLFEPNILVNNYYRGTFIDTYFHKTNPENFSTEFNNNILPTLKITQECISLFRKKKYGKIVNILSSSLKHAPLGTSVYNANKAYLLQMNKHWATENVKFGITSNAVSPAFTHTDFHKGMDERQVDAIIAAYPLNNNLEGKDIAQFIGLCINGGPHFNGNHVFLDASNS